MQTSPLRIVSAKFEFLELLSDFKTPLDRVVGDKVEIGEDGKPNVVGKLGEREAIGRTYKKSDWNDYVIRCEGNRVRHWLNGIQTIELIDNDVEPAVGKDGKPNPYLARCIEGILALQIHAGPPMWVEYKNVRIKELK